MMVLASLLVQFFAVRSGFTFVILLSDRGAEKS